MSDFIDSDLPLPQMLWLFCGFCYLLYNLCLGSGTKISLSLCLPVMNHTWMFTWYRWEGESWEETQQQFDLNFRASNQVDWITSLSLRLHSYWGSLKSRKIPPTERGDLKRLWIYRTPCPHNKGATISLYSLNLTISLRNSSFFLYRLQGVKFRRCEICATF